MLTSSPDFLPLRFGDRRYTRIDPGETSVEFAFPLAAGGVTSAAAWWGPGIRNALLMSNNAAGIPQAYLRTTKPLSTRFGDVEAYWMLGDLQESPFFDSDSRNDLRFLNAGVVTLRVAADTGLTAGIARAVYGTIRHFEWTPLHIADVLIDWSHAPLDGPVTHNVDQMLSLFGRWVIPEAGLAAYFEWATPHIPSSLREILVDPEFGQGYTVGLEWATRMSPSTTVRWQAEATDLEQTPETVGGLTPEFYASHAVPQGYTQQGQAVGATIGPGSSSQFLGSTLFRGSWQVGITLGRIRWQDDAYYRAPSEGRFAWRTHDVSIFAGVNVRHDWRWMQIDAELMRTHRLNYLFQTPDAFLPDNTSFDIYNTTISVGLTPHLAWRRAARGND